MRKESFYGIESDNSEILIRIEGLVPMGDGTYTIEGLKARDIDWQATIRALGYTPDDYPDNELLDIIGDAVFKYDIRRALTNRISRC